MKIVIALLKPFSFVPAILMMFLIYSFSAQSGEVSGDLSYKISYTIVETKNEVLNEGKGYDELSYEADSIHYYVRKAAHMTEYAIFSIFVMIALIVDGIKGVRIPVISAVIAIAFAATDEFHQTFVPGRYGCVLDVLIDAAGSIIGLIVVYIIYKNMCKHKGEKCYNIN